MPENEQSPIFDTLHRTLLELGLSDKESSLYGVALKTGPVLVSRLSKLLNIDRANTYKLIKRLEEKRLASFSQGKGYNRRLLVESPSRIVELLRERRSKIEAIDRDVTDAMPDILAQFKQGESASKVKIIQGQKGFLELFFQILEEEKGELKFLGSAEDFISFVSWAEEKRWIKKRMQQNQKINVLLLESETSKTLSHSDKEQLRETRILKGVKPFVTGFQLFANKVIIWQPKAPLAILIEDEYITKMFVNIFDFWWEQTNPKT